MSNLVDGDAKYLDSKDQLKPKPAVVGEYTWIWEKNIFSFVSLVPFEFYLKLTPMDMPCPYHFDQILYMEETH